MKRNVMIGIIYYLFYLIMGWPEFHLVEAFVLLSILLFTPLSFIIIDKNRRDGLILPMAKWICILYPFAAMSAVFAFLTDQAVFSLIWFVYTGLVALFGLSRFMERGWKPLGELSIDSGFMYFGLKFLEIDYKVERIKDAKISSFMFSFHHLGRSL
jgi:hypothetical protein